jgi:hypothetical protein
MRRDQFLETARDAVRPSADALLAAAKSLREYDQRRDSLPGEHALVLAAGTAALTVAAAPRVVGATPTKNKGQIAWRIALGLIGVALLARGLSGRDGLQSWIESRR